MEGRIHGNLLPLVHTFYKPPAIGNLKSSEFDQVARVDTEQAKVGWRDVHCGASASSGASGAL